MILILGCAGSCSVEEALNALKPTSRLQQPLVAAVGHVKLKCATDEVRFEGICMPRLKDFWNATRIKNPIVEWYRWVWNNKHPRRWNLHAWKCLLDKLPTLEYLQYRGFQLASRCSLCEVECESSTHILFRCDFLEKIWREISSSMKPKAILDIFYQRSEDEALLTKAVWYHVWSLRNNVIFNGARKNVKMICSLIRQDYDALASGS